MGVSQQSLEALYAKTDDPWDFRTSPYEAAKFDATLAALPAPRFGHVLELGCGNGELARRLAPRAARYTGLDAVSRALEAAAKAVPEARLVHARLPCPLPDPAGAPYELILLSEILYFLDHAGLRALGREIDAAAPAATLLAVTWLGPSGNRLQGGEAVTAFAASTPRPRRCLRRTGEYRIDLFSPLGTKE